MADVDDIVRGLTSEERKALLLHRPLYGTREHGWPGSAVRDPMSFQRAGKPLMNAGLICWTKDPRSSRTALTDLGKLVRARLLSSSGEG